MGAGVISMMTDSIAMIDVECPLLPQGVGHTLLDSKMTDGVNSALSVGGWKRLEADQRFAPGGRRSEFSCVTVVQQDSQSIRRCEYSPVGP